MIDNQLNDEKPQISNVSITPFHYQISFADETVTEMWSVTLDKLARKFAHDHKISAIFKHFRNLSPSQDSMVCLPSPKPVGLVMMGPDTEHSYEASTSLASFLKHVTSPASSTTSSGSCNTKVTNDLLFSILRAGDSQHFNASIVGTFSFFIQASRCSKTKTLLIYNVT